MLVWNYFGGKQVAKLYSLRRFLVARMIGLISMLGGITFEKLEALQPYRETSRWIIAASLTAVSTYYLLAKPWDLQEDVRA